MILPASEGGINVSGPYPTDTVFVQALDGKFDCVVAMYHDQGLIPIKLLAWEEAVNVTLRLPIIRTSPDYGTAFDISGKNKAGPSSIIAAISLAVDPATGKGRAMWPRGTRRNSFGNCPLPCGQYPPAKAGSCGPPAAGAFRPTAKRIMQNRIWCLTNPDYRL